MGDVLGFMFLEVFFTVHVVGAVVLTVLIGLSLLKGELI